MRRRGGGHAIARHRWTHDTSHRDQRSHILALRAGRLKV